MLTWLVKTFTVMAVLSMSPSSAINRTQCDSIARQLSESFAAVFRHVDDLVNGVISAEIYAERTDRYKSYPLNITFNAITGVFPNGTEVAKFLKAGFTFEFTIFHHRELGDICTDNEVSARATARVDAKIRGTENEYYGFGGYIDLFGRRDQDGVFRVFKYVEVTTPFFPLGVIRTNSSTISPPPTMSPTKCHKGKKCKNFESSSEENTSEGFVVQSNNQQLDLTPFYVVLSMMVGVILVLLCGLCYLTNQFLRMKSTPMLLPKLGDAGSEPGVEVSMSPRHERVRSGSTSEMI